MNPKLAFGATVTILLALALGGAVFWERGPAPPLEAAAADAPLPVPPVPPRIAVGQDYENCLDMLPVDPAGAGEFAEAWTARGGGEAATHCLALSRIELGDPEQGAAMLQALAAASHASDAARAAILGQADQAWFMAGRTAEAFAAASRALLLSPDDVGLLMDRAVAAGSLDRYADALDDLTRALERDPRRPDALVLRATALRHLQHLDLALGDIEHALALDPDNAEALLERGVLRQRRDDAPGARGDWERAITLAPDSGTADLARQDLALLDAGPERK